MPSIQVLRTELRRRIAGVRATIGEQGLATTVRRIAVVVGSQLAYPLIRARRRRERFGFRGQQLPYATARYNNSFLNERTVEIAIAEHFLSGRDTGRMLEVGNVLSHYGHGGHTVVDKYETVPGVLNEDIIDYKPEQPFDTVVAISTLEHVGWDEQPRDPDKVFRAVDAVRNCAADGGHVLVTIPIGYNQRLDEGLRTGEVRFTNEIWMVRTNQRNDWVEADREETLTKKYGEPFTGANGMYIGMITD